MEDTWHDVDSEDGTTLPASSKIAAQDEDEETELDDFRSLSPDRTGHWNDRNEPDVLIVRRAVRN